MKQGINLACSHLVTGKPEEVVNSIEALVSWSFRSMLGELGEDVISDSDNDNTG